VSRITVYVPRDSAARALGADETAAALAVEAARRGQALEVVRNGSRGLFWLEPLLEVVTPAGRMAYGPVQADDVPALLDAGALQGGAHALGLGPVDLIPYLAAQRREVFARAGVTDPLSLADYAAHGGWAGLRAALAQDGAAVVEQVLASGLRGRGGAAFPAGIKWRTVRGAAGARKHIVCNADEGDSGTFSDRMLMEGDPYALLEGMAIAGLAVGAAEGWIYVRSEYPDAIDTLQEAVSRATAAGWLGDSVAGSGRACARPSAATSAARRRRCSRAWRAGAASCAPSRRCRRWPACSASPRWCTTSSHWPACRRCWRRAPPPTRRWAAGARAARCRSSWPAM
jgi:formate dehydrogenase iron-sulfur subunit